ncbi:MAG: hypothetical protein AAFZ07_02405 [Actinomycetota bacterium]
MSDTQTPAAPSTGPLAADVLALAPRVAQAVRSGRAVRIAAVGTLEPSALADLAALPNATLVRVDAPDGPPASPGVRLVAAGPFDLVVVGGAVASLGAPLDLLVMCRTALVDRGVAVTVSRRTPALDALAVAAGFTVVATVATDAQTLTVFRP